MGLIRVALSLLAFRPGRIGGAETYLRQLLAELPALAGDDRIVAVLDRDLAAQLETPGIDRVVLPFSSRQIVGLRILEAFTPYRARAIARAFAATGADVALFPQQSIFPVGLRVPSVVMVHDVQHLFHPERFGPFDRVFRATAYPRSLRAARRILVNSEWTGRTLTERCGVDRSRLTVTRLGYAPVDAGTIAPFEGLPGSYLYYPAATYPHKNHEALLRSFAVLRRQGAMPHRLVLSGERTPLWRRLQALAHRLGITEDVIHLGFVPYRDVLRLYAGAAAVVFPSLFEGFGLPIVEAAQLAKRVIVSRLEVFDELGVPREWQIDFADPAQLRAALERSGTFRLLRAPETWKDTARETLRALRDVARGAGAGPGSANR